MTGSKFQARLLQSDTNSMLVTLWLIQRLISPFITSFMLKFMLNYAANRTIVSLIAKQLKCKKGRPSDFCSFFSRCRCWHKKDMKIRAQNTAFAGCVKIRAETFGIWDNKHTQQASFEKAVVENSEPLFCKKLFFLYKANRSNFSRALPCVWWCITFWKMLKKKTALNKYFFQHKKVANVIWNNTKGLISSGLESKTFSNNE